MVKLTGILSQINPCKVLVIGDLMLDTYTIGKARRISPEAPVAVVHVQREEHRPGGAGNVILNLISLGSEVVAMGRIGNDSAGSLLTESLIKEGVDVRGVFCQEAFRTPVKNRILAENQQIVRIDHEETTPLPKQLEHQIIARFPELLCGVKVVAISDYGKGFLTHSLLYALIQEAKKNNIPIISDPKGVDFAKYRGSTIIKPNLGEAYAAANLTPDMPLENAAERILKGSDIDTLMVTRSEAGISLFHKDGQREDFPVRVREVKDVTGAGDTVLATLACALANEISLSHAVRLSNVTAGMAIERFGCARITLQELARRLLEEDVTNKVFDEEHLFALKAALRNRNFVFLSLSGVEGMNSTSFSAIRRIAKSNQGDLLIHVRDANPDEEFVSLLASLHEVDFILLNMESVHKLCKEITPVEMHHIDQGRCTQLTSLGELLSVI